MAESRALPCDSCCDLTLPAAHPGHRQVRRRVRVGRVALPTKSRKGDEMSSAGSARSLGRVTAEITAPGSRMSCRNGARPLCILRVCACVNVCVGACTQACVCVRIYTARRHTITSDPSPGWGPSPQGPRLAGRHARPANAPGACSSSRRRRSWRCR